MVSEIRHPVSLIPGTHFLMQIKDIIWCGINWNEYGVTASLCETSWTITRIRERVSTISRDVLLPFAWSETSQVILSKAQRFSVSEN